MHHVGTLTVADHNILLVRALCAGLHHVGDCIISAFGIGARVHTRGVLNCVASGAGDEFFGSREDGVADDNAVAWEGRFARSTRSNKNVSCAQNTFPL